MGVPRDLQHQLTVVAACFCDVVGGTGDGDVAQAILRGDEVVYLG